VSVAERRQRERERRRAEILEAAQEVFVRHGLAAATMDQVAAAANLSKGTLYLYFRSKDELFMGLACEVLDASRERLERIAEDTALSGLECFREVACAYAEVALSRPNTMRNALIWFASGDMVDTETEGFRAYRAKVEGIRSIMMSVLVRGQKDGSIRPELDPSLTMAHVWPSLMSSVVMCLNSDELERRMQSSIDRQQLVPGLIDLLVRGIAANPYATSETSEISSPRASCAPPTPHSSSETPK